MKNSKLILLFILLVILIFGGCATTIQQNIADEETITGADWSAKDVKDVSEYMVSSIIKTSRTPGSVLADKSHWWILARDLKNETDEHINTRVIMEKIRTRLINEGVARFVDDQALNDILNQLKLQQSGLFDSKTVAQVGKLVGAKYILRGTISNIRKRSERKDIVYYNIILQIVNIETGEIVWTDEKEVQRLKIKGIFR
ncbi:MAG TPA: penicillin-binding protein activator LpoB [Syntrophales bacterium]|nr:penicillin-binding protein activator LpoB [Syntrophales bacterium]HOL59702.1 penicillin-binding protein activator LpoB [Syntrophales bacterium]HPO35848.1 penicillin-binding protein activator LpoB [Syntrophales bacterium]